MKNIYFLGLFLFLTFSAASCFDDWDDREHFPSDSELQHFVYSGMKQFYLYKEETAVLKDDYFNDDNELSEYLSEFDTPETFFESLLHERDRFSILVSDFKALENQLNGIGMHNGMVYGIVKMTTSNQYFGYVRYVLPHTSAEAAGVKRGMIFNRVDGVSLNADNYRTLLSPDTYTIQLASLAEGSIVSTEEAYRLTKNNYTENPILTQRVIEKGSHKIGYLLYNRFTADFDDELNEVFGAFKDQGVTDLVLDLRYNPGGSIASSRTLAGMITGQFTHQLFAREIYNQNFPDKDLIFTDKTRSGKPLNSLNLSRLYVLTTRSTASASELLINALRPYIHLIQIGDRTVGKYQGSTTVYDAYDFRREHVKPGHTYALQPLILKTINKAGFTDYDDGLPPDMEQREDYQNLGVLGDPDEALLQQAVAHITGQSGAEMMSPAGYQLVGEINAGEPSFRRMYKD